MFAYQQNNNNNNNNGIFMHTNPQVQSAYDIGH